MAKILAVALASMLFAASCTLPQAAQEPTKQTMLTATVGSKTLNIEIADDDNERTLGLSGRESIDENYGLLFIFPQPSMQSFWMKDMKFAIDIIWIKDGVVIGITEDAKPQPGASDSQLKIYSPPSAANNVLEVRSGWAKANQIKVGDKFVRQP